MQLIAAHTYLLDPVQLYGKWLWLTNACVSFGCIALSILNFTKFLKGGWQLKIKQMA